MGKKNSRLRIYNDKKLKHETRRKPKQMKYTDMWCALISEYKDAHYFWQMTAFQFLISAQNTKINSLQHITKQAKQIDAYWNKYRNTYIFASLIS